MLANKSGRDPQRRVEIWGQFWDRSGLPIWQCKRLPFYHPLR
jgi:hypothetical protein